MPQFASLFGMTPAQPAGSKAGGALALSGGGFRAMLFHAGSLRRLYEVGALREIARVSSVSGGSIAAAVLATRWGELMSRKEDVELFERRVQQPLFQLAGRKIDVPNGLLGLLTPGRSIAQTLAKVYGRVLDHKTLQDLPDSPRFVFCATNLGSGSLVRFAKKYTADYRIGKRSNLPLPLGDVVAASAAFPPMLSPMVIKLGSDERLSEQFPRKPGDEPPPLEAKEPYASRLELTDGGVYDNLGLQPIEQFHTFLVSDGGGPFEYEPSVPVNWLGHMIRAWKVTDNQVRSLRRSDLVDEYKGNRRLGAYWGIQTKYSDYQERVVPVHDAWADRLKCEPTRLSTVAERRRKELINWGYAITDAAIRTYVEPGIALPALPCPEAPLDSPPPETR